MEKQQDTSYKNIIKEYESKDPSVAKAIRTLQDKYENQQSILRLFRHDMRGPLISIEGLSNPKRWSKLSDEKRTERILMMHSSAQVANNRMGLLELTDISEKELRRYSENIKPAELAKNYARSVEGYLNRSKVGLQIKYNEELGAPLEVYAHKAAMGSIIENLIGGGLNHAIEKSRIKLGIRKTKLNLEIMAENRHFNEERIRNIAGEARGFGLPFMKRITKTFDGSVEIYNYKKMNSAYNECARFGYLGKESISPSADLFGIKLTIPLVKLKK